MDILSIVSTMPHITEAPSSHSCLKRSSISASTSFVDSDLITAEGKYVLAFTFSDSRGLDTVVIDNSLCFRISTRRILGWVTANVVSLFPNLLIESAITFAVMFMSALICLCSCLFVLVMLGPPMQQSSYEESQSIQYKLNLIHE